MKTYVKLEGDKVNDGIKALEKLAIGMPEVCITNTFIQSDPDLFNTQTGILNYFPSSEGLNRRCETLVSKDKDTKGYDFVFEWFVAPTNAQINDLKVKMDEVLEPLGLKYKAESR
jgi:hypothetical protein